MLNNHNKEQFMNRSGSFSTHGSRRGYSDLGLPMEYSDFLPAADRRKILIDKFNFLNSIYPSSRKIREDKTRIMSMLGDIKT